jgi:hypothetical protein
MMAFLDSTHKAQIKDQFKHTLPHGSLSDLLDELAKLELAFRLLVFTGNAGAGACTLTGTKVGDKVIGILNLTDAAIGTSSFEATITVANQIQQSSASDLSAKNLAVLLVAKS